MATQVILGLNWTVSTIGLALTSPTFLGALVVLLLVNFVPSQKLWAISEDLMVGEGFWSPETSTHQPTLLGYMSELKKEHSADIKLLKTSAKLRAS